MFGNRLRELMQKQGISQADMAKRINITSSMVNQIIRGTKQATAPLIAEIAKELGCTTDYLIYGQESN